MNYVEFTDNLIMNCVEESESIDNIVVLGPGYNVKGSMLRRFECAYGDVDVKITYPKNGEDICDFCDRYKFSPDFELADLVIMSRVLEHIPVRQVDWYLCNIYTIMNTNSTLLVIVPDMKSCVEKLEEEFAKPNPDLFLITRLQYEILSEGTNVWDRHSLYTSETSIGRYLVQEGLFEVSSIEYVTIDSPIVPKQILVKAKRV